jgi:hypothetical protein
MRKRCLTVILTLVLVVMAFPMLAKAADEVASGTCGDNLTWTLDSDGLLTISGTGEMSDYTSQSRAPWYGDGYGQKIKRVIIKPGVTSIGDYAFTDCSNPTNITIPESVTRIGNYAFNGCSNLNSITIPTGVISIGNYAFYGCSSLTSIEIPEGVTSIGICAFGECSRLTSITIPESVTGIGESAFQNCSSLTGITLPGGLTSIGEGVFYDCSGMTSITIPESVTSIGRNAFYRCFLSDVYYEGDESAWEGITIGEFNSLLTDATIHYNSTASFKTASIKTLSPTIPSDQYMIIVMDSAGNYIKNAKVKWSYGSTGQVVYTDKNGEALVDRLTVGQPTLEVSCDGYLTYSNENSNYQKSDEHYEVIVLYKEDADKYKLQSAFFVGKTDLLTDLLTESVTLNTENDGKFCGDFTLTCKAISTDDVKTYELWQNSKRIKTSKNGSFSLNVGDGFKSGGGCHIRVISTNGTKVDTAINLTFVSDEVNEASGFTFGDSPSITVADSVPVLGGSTFNLGSLDVLPVEFQVTTEKLYIGFNADIWPSDSSSSTETNSSNSSANTDTNSGSSNSEEQTIKLFKQYKEDFQKAKKAVNMVLNTQNADVFKNNIRNDCDFALPGGEVSVKVTGYAECSWGESTAKGEIYILCSMTTPTYGFTTWVAVVPVTVQVSSTFDVQAGLSASYDWKNATFVGDLPIELSVKLKIFGGVGVGKCVGAGAYGSGELKAEVGTFTTYKGLKTLDLTGELGIEAYVGMFEYTKSFAHNTWHLYTANTVTSKANAARSQTADLYDQDTYALADLTYLEDESEWLGESGGIALLSLDDEETVNDFTPLQIGTYRNMQPVIGTAGNTPVMVWMRADTSRETINATQLVYSVYQDGVWSQPQPVDSKNVTADGTHALYTDGNGNLYLVYQRASEQLSNSSTLEDYAAVQSIVVATFQTDTMSFSEVTKLSADDSYSYAPAIGGSQSATAVVWVANQDSSDIFGQNSTNEICYAQYNQGKWSSQKTLVTGQNAVISVEVGQLDGELCVAVLTDQDNDLSTTNDHALTVYRDLNSEGTLLVTGSMSQIQFATLPGETEVSLLWAASDALYSYSGTKTTKVLETEALTAGFQVLSDRIIWSDSTEDASELYAMVYHDGWQEPIQLTDQGDYLQSYDVVEVNGTTYVVAVQAQVTITEDDVEDDCTLSWATLYSFTDLGLDGAYADDSQASAGEPFDLMAVVTNYGDQPVEQYTITIQNGDTVVASQTVTETLSSGESVLQTISIPALDASVYQASYTVTVAVENDVKLGNNTAEVVVGYADLAISAELVQVGDTKRALVTVTNNSLVPAGGTLYADCGEDTPQSIVIDDLAYGESTVVAVTLGSAITESTENSEVSLELVCNQEEWNESNNKTTLVVIATAVADTHTPGDINDDGKVDTNDLVRLMKKISENAQETYLDINGDGKVDTNDLIRLMKYLTDNSVEIH